MLTESNHHYTDNYYHEKLLNQSSKLSTRGQEVAATDSHPKGSGSSPNLFDFKKCFCRSSFSFQPIGDGFQPGCWCVLNYSQPSWGPVLFLFNRYKFFIILPACQAGQGVYSLLVQGWLKVVYVAVQDRQELSASGVFFYPLPNHRELFVNLV